MPRRAAPVTVAALALALAGGLMAGSALAGETITGADYAEPTTRYGHDVLGGQGEWGALRLTLRDGTQRLFRQPPEMVFEDLAPRLADLDGDGTPEVIVVESHQDRGARLAVWGPAGRIAAAPFIGTRNRWLAPLGAADLDDDGAVEIAWVDRPHLAKVLRVWRWTGGELVPVAEAGGVSNHKIGAAYIEGGIADCPNGPVMVTASADWSRIVHSRLEGGQITMRDAGPYGGPETLAPGRAC